MRMIECNIMNFGTLSDFHYDFEEGINRIVRGNGFGKSTLAAFIRVMLYGFEGEGKRDNLSRERKFYEPWQGGKYGGDIVFETDGKLYRVTRTFGNKADSDTFELRDMNSNLVVDDYSERLGIELFDMDSETFRKTVFVGQDSVETSVNDTINGRIGALVDNTDDLNAFENAKGTLEGMINSLSPRRKTGDVWKLNDRITSLDADIIDAGVYEKSMESILEMRNAEEEKLTEMKAEKDKLAVKAKQLGAYMEVINKKDRYEHLMDDLSLKETELSKIKKLLPPETDITLFPEPEEIREKAQNYVLASSELASTRLIELTEDEKIKYERIKDLYKDDNPTEKAEKLIEACRSNIEIGKEITMKEARKFVSSNEREKEEKAGKRVSMIFYIAAFAVAIVGTVLFFVLKNAAVAYITPVIMLLCIAFAHILSAGNHKTAKQRTMECDIIDRDTEIMRNHIDSVNDEIKEFLERYNKTYKVETAEDMLREVIGECEDFKTLRQKKLNASEASSEAQNKLERTAGYILNLGAEPEEDMYAQLMRLADISERAKKALEAYEASKNAVRIFKEENDIDTIMSAVVPETDESLGEVTSKLEEYSRLVDESAERLKTFDKRSDELSQSLDEIESKRSERDLLKEERDRKQEAYDCCVIAKNHLEKAKETLSSRYIKPIFDKFMYYHTMITGNDTHEYMVDAKIDVSVKEHGLTHSVLQLSKGLRDVVGLSLRMAFIDVMFPDEKPVLILDDPFVNLDRTNLEAAEKLMEIIGKDYQVIYFAAREEIEPQIQM
ncbi:MAG: AAA family ATPase [Lachnospiraceae bacterium]|nr:AAA family ATPase [Lachnospiraceae bacterium]